MTLHYPPNELFRAARLRLPSPSGFGPMSREELADVANQYLRSKKDADGPITADMISRIEQGRTAWPRANRRAALRKALGVDNDGAIGLFNRRRRGSDGPAPTPAATLTGELSQPETADTIAGIVTSRRATILTAIGAVAAASGLLGRPDSKARLGGSDVIRIRAVIGLYRSVDYECGGGALYREVGHFAEQASGLLDHTISGSLRPALLVAIAEAWQLAGWTAFDTGLHSDAQRHWLSAERAAVAAGDVRLAARVRYCQARQFQHLRHNRDAVETLRLARDHLGTAATPAITAMLDGAEAASLADLGDHDAALARLGTATDAFDQVDADREPDWMRFYDRGEVLAQYGRVYRDMARHDRRHGPAAVRQVTAAISAFGATNVRSTVCDLPSTTTMQHGGRPMQIWRSAAAR